MPCGPCDPSTPAGPGGPCGPSGPCCPSGPGGPGGPLMSCSGASGGIGASATAISVTSPRTAPSMFEKSTSKPDICVQSPRFGGTSDRNVLPSEASDVPSSCHEMYGTEVPDAT